MILSILLPTASAWVAATVSSKSRFSSNTKNFLDHVWSVYGKKDAAYLEYLSHSETPWQKAREGLEPHIGSENEISLKDMKEFYTSKLSAQKRT